MNRCVLKISIVIALAAGLIGSLLPVPAGASPAISPDIGPPPKIHWSPCYREYGPFECGTVQVPIDYDSPQKGVISIAVVRLAASDPAHRIGSLFLNPGGPGGSGFDFAISIAPYLYTSEVRARFDIVGFDPRGIGRSTALRCFGTPKQWTPYFTPFAFPMTPEEEAWWIAADMYMVDACAQRGTRVLDYMSTANVARDMDRLRQAVGDEMLNYAGYSYGSYLGVTYANLFPDKVRAVIVDAVLDPVLWATGLPGQEDLPFSTRIRSDAGAMATLSEFFRLCDARPDNCAFGPDSAARYAVMAAGLRAGPMALTMPDGSSVPFTYQDLVANTLSPLYDSFSWYSYAQFLAYLEAFLHPASAPSPAAFGAAPAFDPGSVGFITKRGFPHYPNYVEGFPGVACADSDNPDTYAAWWKAAWDADRDYGYFGPMWTYASSACAKWPGLQIGRYTGPFDRATAHPVLVMNNLYDPATRYEGAVSVAAMMPNSHLITVAGWGHATLFLSQCATEAAAEYLLTGQPSPVSYCTQDWTPFTFVPTQGGAADASARLRGHLLQETVF